MREQLVPPGGQTADRLREKREEPNVLSVKKRMKRKELHRLLLIKNGSHRMPVCDSRQDAPMSAVEYFAAEEQAAEKR